MPFPLVAFWRKDTALNSYIFCLFLIGLPFTIFATYVIYQLQVVGFIIGTDIDGQPCGLEYCLVPFGRRKIDLNSAILYLNALGFGIGGVLALIISAYADFLENKSHLVTFFILLYGAIAAPAYWLKDPNQLNFSALMALYVAWAVITYILSSLLNMYIPHCMRKAGERNRVLPSSSGTQQTLRTEVTIPKKEINILSDETPVPAVDSEVTFKPESDRKYGFKMSILGGIGTTVGGVVGLILVIILAKTLPADQSQTSGLLITSVVGFITFAGSVIAYFGLPIVPPKLDVDRKTWWLEVLTPLKDLLHRKNMLVLLLSYTIYVDTVFALSSVTSQLYFITVVPDAIEYSLYALAGTLFQLLCSFGFMVLQVFFLPSNLESLLIMGYGIILIVPLWGCIGLAPNIDFGFKNRWEFYVQNLLFNLSGAIVNPVFRVLFAEMIPKGSEIEWFGLQVVLSCATTWVSYVTNAPLQNATHQLRFPLVLCLILLVCPPVLEVLRRTMPVFAKDRLRWQANDAR